MAQKKLATEILHREYAKSLVNLALARADKLNTVKQSANAWGALGTLAGNAVTAFRGAAKPAAKAVTPVADAAATAAKPAAKVVAPAVDAAATAAKPGIRLPNAPLVSAKQRAALDAARNSGDPAAVDRLLYNSPFAPSRAAPTPVPYSPPPAAARAATPTAAPKPAPAPAPAPAAAPAPAPAAGGVPAPSAPVPAPAGSGGNPATAAFDRWKRLTGLAGPRAGYVMAGNSVLHQGAQQIEENTGVPLTSNPVAGALMFPFPTAAGYGGQAAVAVADAVFPSSNQPQADLAAPTAQAPKFDMAAGDALLPQTAAQPPSQFETFLANNNIRSIDDVAKLSPELQAQFNTLAVDGVGANPKPEAPQTAATEPPPAAPIADKERLPYAAGGAGGVAATGAGTAEPVADKPKLTPEQQTAAATDLQAKLKTTTDPKARETLITDYASTLNLDKPTQAAAAAFARGEKTPEAQAFEKEYMQPALGNFVNDATGGAGASSPREFGQISQMWEGLGTAGQMAFAIGVPLALLGVLGGSGAGMLLGALGIGAAGLAGASGGLFGQEAADAANSGIESVIGALGGKAPNEADIRSRLEAAARQGPDAAKAELAKVREEVGPYANFSATAEKFMTDSKDPNYMYNNAAQYVNQNFNTLAKERLQEPGWDTFAARLLGLSPEAAKPGTLSARYFGAPGTPERAKVEAQQLANRGWREVKASLNVMRKAARCWAGYEPVPGKAPYSENSCRPKRKAKKKKAEKTAEQYSEQPFNPAIGYKHPNPKATPMDIYKNQMSRSRVEIAKKARNPNYQFSNAYTMAKQHYGKLPPAPPPWPSIARPQTTTSTDIDPPALPPAPAPSPFNQPRPAAPTPSPFKAAPRPQSPPTSAATAAPAEKPIHMRNPATLDADGMRAWWDHQIRQQAMANAARRPAPATAAPAKPAPPPKVR